ncbi:unnamed protein product [Ectocarpus sp. 4 AP-2014]
MSLCIRSFASQGEQGVQDDVSISLGTSVRRGLHYMAQPHTAHHYCFSWTEQRHSTLPGPSSPPPWRHRLLGLSCPRVLSPMPSAISSSPPSSRQKPRRPQSATPWSPSC